MYTERIEWLGRVFYINRATPEAARRDRLLKIAALRTAHPKPRRQVLVRAA